MNRLLVTLPFAGAHMNVFASLSKVFLDANDHGEVHNHSYPGHGPRIREQLLPTVTQMANDCADAISDRASDFSVDVILVGYSMGSLVAFELCSILEVRGINVSHCILMASTPPQALQYMNLEVDSDDDLIQHCQQYGLLEENAFASEDVRNVFLPSLRNDIVAVNDYAAHSPRPAPLPEGVRVGIFNGRDDLTVSDTARWDELVTGVTRHYYYDGGHFFFFDESDQALTDIDSFLTLLPAETGKDNHGHS